MKRNSFTRDIRETVKIDSVNKRLHHKDYFCIFIVNFEHVNATLVVAVSTLQIGQDYPRACMDALGQLGVLYRN